MDRAAVAVMLVVTSTLASAVALLVVNASAVKALVGLY